jgi:Nas2 N_terminal domain
MGLELPSPTSPAERARTLMARKESLEAELDSQLSILKSNNVTLNSPLVDREGFPRADIDIWAVRHARVRAIELRNDLNAVMDEIGKALEGVYTPTKSQSKDDSDPELKPFAKVDAVAPGSPAASAVSVSVSYRTSHYFHDQRTRDCNGTIWLSSSDPCPLRLSILRLLCNRWQRWFHQMRTWVFVCMMS